MRHRLPPLPCPLFSRLVPIVLVATASVACGGAEFEDALPDGGNDDGATSSLDDGATETSAVTVGPRDGAPAPKDAGGDSTTLGHPDASLDAATDSAHHTDSSADAGFDSPATIESGLVDSTSPADTGEADACAGPDTVHGVFVSTSSSATTGCGSVTAPCGTIASGIAAAQAGKTIVYLDQGTYGEQVALVSGITVTGGWIYAGGGVWTMQCTGNASALAVIQPVTALKSVLANGVTATLDTLTVKSKATALAGESLYGVFVSGSANLALNAVSVVMSAAGGGSAGGLGATPPGPACTAAQDGNPAGPATPGVPKAATYSSTGYTPGTGGAGSSGLSGDDGTAAPTLGMPGGPTSTTSYQVCDTGSSGTCLAGATPIVGNVGTFGCGGPGGAPGLGGGGGGSSIALFVWQGSVEVTDGSLASGKGGNGGAGATGATAATSWSSQTGSPGAATSVPTCTPHIVGGQPNCTAGTSATSSLAGAAGGAGGEGSQGGTGASGTGGDSYSYYAGGGGSVALNGSPALSNGSAGTSPGPIPGGDGNAGPHNP